MVRARAWMVTVAMVSLGAGVGAAPATPKSPASNSGQPPHPEFREKTRAGASGLGSPAVQRIYLVRHGIAGDPDEWKGPDDSRPLNAEGRQRFRETARAFTKLGDRVELLCTSPLVRAVKLHHV